MSKEALALAVKVEHPHFSDAEVADAAGCHVKSLYRMKKFTAAKEILKEGRATLPTGSKPTDEPMEAWEDENKDDAES
ncbi:MAG TPA: hypothetical protein VNA25_10880 [Phycisphaerae bacterium]|nr:hypothetical protein [Phycisphaerae bacterium]